MNINENDYKIDIVNNIFVQAGTDDMELLNWDKKLVSTVRGLGYRDNNLKPLIQFLVTTIRPAKIYKLEHTTVKYVTDQYTDLLIIISGEDNRPFTELEPILEMPYIKQQTVCCSLHNEGSLLEALKAGHVFYSLHCIAENIVYDDGKLTYPVTAQETLDEIKQEARANFRQYIQKALDFSEAAAYFTETRPSDITAFLLHQAAELTYRGVLKHLNGYDKKTHELRALMKYVRRCAPQLCNIFSDNTTEETRLLDLIEKAYLKSRYEQEFIASKEDISILLDKVVDLQRAAISIVAMETE